MKIYWTPGQIPELAHLPPKVRRHVWTSCYYRTFKSWLGWLLITSVALPAGLYLIIMPAVFSYISKHPTSNFQPILLLIGAFLIIVLLAGVSAAIIGQIFTEYVMRPLIRQYLQENPLPATEE